MVRLGENNVCDENEEGSVDSARVSLDDSHDPYFPPVVTLPLVEVNIASTGLITWKEILFVLGRKHINFSQLFMCN